METNLPGSIFERRSIQSKINFVSTTDRDQNQNAGVRHLLVIKNRAIHSRLLIERLYVILFCCFSTTFDCSERKIFSEILISLSRFFDLRGFNFDFFTLMCH
jgi:hypothetical protein